MSDETKTNWTEEATKRSLEIWADFQQQHDVSEHLGEVAGIDPVTEQVWFGKSATDIAKRMEQTGTKSAFYCVRVGHDYYVRKGWFDSTT